MARPVHPGEQPARGPTARWLAGWLAAIGIVAGIAFVAGIPGPGVPGAPALETDTPDAASPVPIDFGTALDASSGAVSAGARTERFRAGDTFAYSVLPDAAVEDAVWVEVLRIEPDRLVSVQEPTRQALPPGSSTIAFSVPTTNLLAAFEAGEFMMRIYLHPEAEPVAVGRFRLLGE